MEVPRIFRLDAEYRSVFAVVRTMRADDADIGPVFICLFAKHFADFFAAALLTLLARADIHYFGGRVFFFAHALLKKVCGLKVLKHLLRRSSSVCLGVKNRALPLSEFGFVG